VGMSLIFGLVPYLLIQLLVMAVAGTVGTWMFYVQHQFEGVYWERGEDWDFVEAALKGSSYLRLPKVLQFFTGNIGLHHVHHLSTRIPNYNLQRAHDSYQVFRQVPTLSMLDGMRCLKLKLWDEERGRLVTFRQAHAG